jgi:hypothetical protein
MSDPTTPAPSAASTLSTTPGELSEETKKTRADFYMKLSDRAWDRLKSKRGFEWRVAFGIWSAFAAGTGFVLTSTSVSVGWPAFLGGFLLSALILWYFLRSWLPYMKKTFDEDWQRAVGWEKDAIELLGLNNPTPANRTQYISHDLHSAQWMQFWISFLFACLFIGALGMRLGEDASNNRPASIRVEGGSLDIDSTAVKLRLGK